MTTSLRCPMCEFRLADAPAGSVRRSSEGQVHYLRCVCGLWLVVLAGQVIGAAGVSDFADRAA